MDICPYTTSIIRNCHQLLMAPVTTSDNYPLTIIFAESLQQTCLSYIHVEAKSNLNLSFK